MTYAVELHDFKYIQWEHIEVLEPRFETEAAARLYCTALEMTYQDKPLVFFEIVQIAD
jgi:hypothetical protein